MIRSLLKTVCNILVLFTMSVAAQAQQAKAPETNPALTPVPPGTQSPAPVIRFDRLAAAKTIYIENKSTNEIPYNVISTSLESWGRYIVVDDRDKAEIVMEISMTGGDSEIKVSDSSKSSIHGGQSGQQDKSQSATKEVTTEEIKIMIYDKNKRPLWSAREEPKFAVRHKAAENRLVEASQRLFARFHDRVEPPPLPKP